MVRVSDIPAAFSSPPDSPRRASRVSRAETPTATALLSIPVSTNGRMGVTSSTTLTITEEYILYGRYEIDLGSVESWVRALTRTALHARARACAARRPWPLTLRALPPPPHVPRRWPT